MVILPYGLEKSEYLPQTVKENVYGINFLFELCWISKMTTDSQIRIFFFFFSSRKTTTSQRNTWDHIVTLRTMFIQFSQTATSLMLTTGKKLIFKRRYHITHKTQSLRFSNCFILIRVMVDARNTGLSSLILMVNNQFNSDLRM